MGEIRQYSCKCGYETDELNYGSGMMGCNTRLAEKVFPQEWQLFLEKKEKGVAEGFLLENAIVFCDKCKTYQSVISLIITYTDGTSQRIIKEKCPLCLSDSLSYVGEDLTCPKCNRKMDFSVCGNWD